MYQADTDPGEPQQQEQALPTDNGAADSQASLPADPGTDADTSGLAPDQPGTTTETVNVYFVDQDRFADGTLPYEQAVKRTFKSGADLKELVLIDLFEGPDADEQSEGLQMVYSGANDFDYAFDRNTGVVTVTLQGGCDSKGATYTVANLIIKNMEQFDDVKAVKILNPQGETQGLSGLTHSIPACLEP
jgi:hypothetical protein